MAVTYLDHEIVSLLEEHKPLPVDWRRQVSLKPKRGHDEQQLDLAGVAGSEFRLILRRGRVNLLDFSIILAVRVPRSNQLFRLRRYNGRSHERTNRIEDVRFYDFHIHVATERYQEIGMREDAYAEPTGRYSDFQGALRCLIDDANPGVRPPFWADCRINTKLLHQNRWDSVKGRLQGIGLTLPNSIPEEDFVGYTATFQARVGVWLMPDNRRSGAIEEFLKDLIADGDTLLQLADTSTVSAKKLGAAFSDAKQRKAVLRTWLAWQKDPGVSYGIAIRERYFQHDSPVALAFVDWFKLVFQDPMPDP